MIDEATRLRIEQRFYPDLRQTIFGGFDAQLQHCLPDGGIVLDAGSGPGSWVALEHKGRFKLLIGEDVYVPDDCSALDAFVLAETERLPFADHSIDAIVSYLVLEHLAEPLHAFREYARVLVPGGYLCFKTPAVRSPLFLLAKVLPTRLHKSLKSRIGTAEDDVFPTYYRANTVADLERELSEAGFRRHWLRTVDQTYAYLTHHPWTYALGLLYSRATEHRALAWLRNQIIGIYRLPEEGA